MHTASITNNTFSNLGYAALQIDETSSDFTIRGNTFITIVNQGINLGAVSGLTTIRDNTMTACNTANNGRGAIRIYAGFVAGNINPPGNKYHIITYANTLASYIKRVAWIYRTIVRAPPVIYSIYYTWI